MVAFTSSSFVTTVKLLVAFYSGRSLSVMHATPIVDDYFSGIQFEAAQKDLFVSYISLTGVILHDSMLVEVCSVDSWLRVAPPEGSCIHANGPQPKPRI